MKLSGNEAAFTMMLADNFDEKWTKYLIVGVAKSFNVSKNTTEIGFITVYKLSPDGKKLELYHKTPTETLP